MGEGKPIWCRCQPFMMLGSIWYHKFEKEEESSDDSNRLVFHMGYFNSKCNLFYVIGFKDFSCQGK